MKYIPLLLLLFLPLVCLGQRPITVEGRVIDDQGAAIPYAAVVISSVRDSMIVSSAPTQSDGTFALRIEDSLCKVPLTMEVTCLRYKGKVIDCPLGVSDLERQITLLDAPIQENIEEVVVSGNKTSFSRQGDRYVFRISPDLEIAKGSSIYDILKITPLVKVDQESITVAGAGAPQIYINGRRSRLSSTGLMAYLKSVPASSLSNIEVLPIANSTYYGEGNFSVIDIKIKKNQGDGVGGMVALETYQSHSNSQTANANLNVRKGKVGVNTSLWASNSGNEREVRDLYMLFQQTGNSSDNTTRNYSSGQNYGADITLDYDINEKQVIGFSVNANYGQSANRSTALTTYASGFNTTIDSLYHTGVSANNYNTNASANINYQLKVGDKGSAFNVEVGYLNYLSLGRQTTIFDRLNGDMSLFYNLDSMFQRLPQRTEAWTGMARYDYAFGRWGTLSMGTDFQTTTSDDNSYYALGNWSNKNENLSNHFVYTETVAALFASYRVGWTDKFSTTLGGRVEYTHTRAEQRTTGNDVNNYRMRFMPSLFLSYNFNQDNSLSYSASTRMSFPGYEYLNSFRTYSSPTHYSQGNPYLRPQRYFNQSLDYNFKGKFSVSLSHYDSKDAPREFTTPDGDNGTKSEIVNFGRNTMVHLSIGMTGSYFKGVWWPNNYLILLYDGMNGMVDDQLFVSGNYGMGLSLNNSFVVSKKHNISFSVSYMTNYISKSETMDRKPLHMLNFDIKKGFGDFYIKLYGYDILRTLNQKGSVINNGIDTRIITQSSYQSFGLQLSYSFGNSSVRSARQIGESSSGVKSRL